MKCSFLKIFLITGVTAFALSCNRESLNPDPHALPGFSTDTVTFDTVFTTIGSATLNFKIYNRSNRPLLISTIALAGGDESFFRINIDGEQATEIEDMEVPPDDSLFVFIAVTIDPTNRNNPVVIRDSILFNTNGNLQDVKLIAYGQDVHLINSRIIGTEVWENDKPYLIYNSMAVDTGQTLTINEGTRIYFHNLSNMIIWGTLLVNGTKENPVLFQNDRLEEFYDIIPGQWGTIFIDPISRGNKINHAVIKNSIAGIQIGYPSDFAVPELELSNSIIMNTSYVGIYAFGAEINCYNTVIANSAGPSVALLRGGDYRFLHCTVSNNGVPGTARSAPSVIITNFFDYTMFDESSQENIAVRAQGDLTRALFANSIVYGFYSHEIQLADNHINTFDFQFDHCLLKAVEDSIDGSLAGDFTSVILNKDPGFKNDSNLYHLDYSLDTLSPAKDAGDPAILLTYPYLDTDFEGKLRNSDVKPDLGAFERKED
jgi:hypothetical protein